jgi:hypothetical protein
MESFEFLGGRYTQPEQIMSGPVQAFRAQNASTGRVVFIHRVSTTEAPAEQAALLKLLTTALVKSAEAKRLVLDFGDESGYWYVVTESEPQCALLREWLQLEIESASANSRPMAPPVPRPVAKTPVPPPPSAPPHAVPSDSDTGEFTRFLKARPSASSPPSSARFTPPPPPPPVMPPPVPPAEAEPKPQAPTGEFTRAFQSPHAAPLPPQSAAPLAAPPAAQAPPVQRPPAGEFTSFFNAPSSEGQPPRQISSGPPQRAPVAEPPADLPPPPGPSKPESGEFTRFFKPGLPSSPPKPPAPAPPNPNLERTQIGPRVQRPNTPVPPPPAKPLEPGEFTQLFSSSPAAGSAPTPPARYQPPTSVRSDPLGFAKQPSTSPNDPSDDLFSDRIDIPKPMPSSQPQHSEFTRMFGSSGAAATPVQPQAVFAPPREKPLVDEPRHTQPLNTQPRPPSDAPPASGPSEFTMIMQGGYGPSKAAPEPAAPPAVPAGLQGLPPLPLPSLKVPPLAPPRPPAPNIQLPKPNVPPLPPVNLNVAGAGNKKMIVFFSVLGVLAVLLVLLALFLMKNK